MNPFQRFEYEIMIVLVRGDAIQRGCFYNALIIRELSGFRRCRLFNSPDCNSKEYVIDPANNEENSGGLERTVLAGQIFQLT